MRELEELDPTYVADVQQLAALLREMHVRAGLPTLRDLEKLTHKDKLPPGLLPGTSLGRVWLGRSSVSQMLKGRELPRKALLLTFVEVCGGIDLAVDRRWGLAWDRLAYEHHKLRSKGLQSGTTRVASGDASTTSVDDSAIADVPAPELVRRMLGSARDLVFDRGVQISIADEIFDLAIERAGVSRTSALRLWPTNSEFARDVLLHIADPAQYGTAAYDERTISLVKDIVIANRQKLGEPLERRRVLLEAIRAGVEQSLNAITESKEWYVYMALNAAARSTGNDQGRLRLAAALLNGQKRLINRFADLYDQMLDVLQMRFRSDAYTTKHMAVIGAAIVEGLALRKFLHLAIDQATQKPDIDAMDWTLSTLIGGSLPGPSADIGVADESWSLAALAYLGIVDALAEPIPSEDPGPE
jgi:hypothetical protein